MHVVCTSLASCMGTVMHGHCKAVLAPYEPLSVELKTNQLKVMKSGRHQGPSLAALSDAYLWLTLT